MATIKGAGPTGKGPSYTGRVMVDVFRGSLRVRKWPRKRGRNLHPKTLEQMEWFRQANFLAKYVATQQQNVAREAAAGSPLLPRDLLIMAMAGRMFAIDFIDGRTLWPVAARTDVSASLDILSAQPGTILVRGDGFWEGYIPGPVGTVLTSTGPGQPPVWAGGGSGGGAWEWNGDYNVPNTSTSSGATATKGVYGTVVQSFDCLGLACTFTSVAGGSYQMHIAEVNGAGVIQSIVHSNTLTVTDAARYPRYFTIAAPLVAGKIYAFLITRTDAGATYALPLANVANIMSHLPIKSQNAATIASVLPVVGNTVLLNTGTPFAVPIGIKFAI